MGVLEFWLAFFVAYIALANCKPLTTRLEHALTAPDADEEIRPRPVPGRRGEAEYQSNTTWEND